MASCILNMVVRGAVWWGHAYGGMRAGLRAGSWGWRGAECGVRRDGSSWTVQDDRIR